MNSLWDLIKLDRPLLIFDTETTGQHPNEDRIVEIGFLHLVPGKEPREWQSYVNPCMPIPKEATYGRPDLKYHGHGITDEMVKDAPTFRELAPHLLRGFTKGTDYGGFNIKTYDLPLMKAEFERNGHTWSFEDARIIDGLRMWQVGEPRSLSDAVEAFLQEKHDGAHRALDDVRASARVMAAQLLRFATLPRDMHQLHELLWPQNPNAIDPQGQIVWKDDVAVMNFGKTWRGKRLDLMARKDLTWIVGPKCAGANATTKRICDNALQGRFPTKENPYGDPDPRSGTGSTEPHGPGTVVVPADSVGRLFD